MVEWVLALKTQNNINEQINIFGFDTKSTYSKKDVSQQLFNLMTQVVHEIKLQFFLLTANLSEAT